MSAAQGKRDVREEEVIQLQLTTAGVNLKYLLNMHVSLFEKKKGAKAKNQRKENDRIIFR